MLARRRRLDCVVGQNTSVLAPCLAPACIASHEIIAVTDFNGAENFCAGLVFCFVTQACLRTVVVHRKGSKLIWTASTFFTTRLIDIFTPRAFCCGAGGSDFLPCSGRGSARVSARSDHELDLVGRRLSELFGSHGQVTCAQSFIPFHFVFRGRLLHVTELERKRGWITSLEYML